MKETGASERQTVRDDIAAHIETAIREGWIHIFYQPVIRALTGKLCGVEALARWEDPERGSLSPAAFIPALEEAGKIFLLDRYVMQGAAKMLHDRFARGRPVVPVSVNLSRHDFAYFDPCAELTQLCSQYDLPHMYLRVEITETVLAGDEAEACQAVRRLGEAGFGVMLDDFGTGYSSLSVLQQYAIDELKIDRTFLQNLTEDGRKIIRSTVLLAKSLGIHTLAEGAETEEQVRFLRETGCENIQGFYYSRPLPLEELEQVLSRRAVLTEERRETAMILQAGRVNFVTSTPAAIACYDGNQFTVLAANKVFLQETAKFGLMSESAVNHRLHASSPAVLRTFQLLAESCQRSRDWQGFTLAVDNRFLSVRARLVAGDRREAYYEVSLQDITQSRNSEEATTRYEIYVRSMMYFYDSIYVLDPWENTIDVVASSIPEYRPGCRLYGIMRNYMKFAESYMHEDDRDRYLTFIKRVIRASDDIDSEEEAASSQISNVFRVRAENGSYMWKVADTQGFLYKGKALRLMCIRDLLLNRLEDRNDRLAEITASYGLSVEKPGREDAAQGLSGENLFQSMLRFSRRKYFWKDAQHRYAGASQAFLGFCGAENLSAIRGRTDKEIGWFINEEEMRRKEDEVLEHGKVIHDEVDTAKMRGRERPILYSKFPVYQGARIVGLIGFYRDIEEHREQEAFFRRLLTTDRETGLHNLRGIRMALAECLENDQGHGRDYFGALLDVPEYERFLRLYGKQEASHFLLEIKRLLLECLPQGVIIGRYVRACFFLLGTGDNVMLLRGAVQEAMRRICAVTEISGCAITLSPRVAFARGSETERQQDFFQILLQRLDVQNDGAGLGAIYDDRLSIGLEAFDYIEDSVMIIDCETRDVCYLNASMRRRMGLPADFSFSGRKCYEIVHDHDFPCEICYMKSTPRNTVRRWKFHSAQAQHDFWVRDIIVTWRLREYRLLIIEAEETAHEEPVSPTPVQERSFVDDIADLAMRETDPERAIREIFVRVGAFFRATRIMLVEERGDASLICRYEWDAPGMSSLRRNYSELSVLDVKDLYEKLAEQTVLVVDDCSACEAAHPALMEKFSGLHSFAAGALLCGERMYGFSIIENPDPAGVTAAQKILPFLMRILALLLRNRDNLRKLQSLTTVDQLTGAMNRRAFMHCMERLEDGVRYAFIFGDINGLKSMNDNHGHEAGDQMICAAAQIMQRFAGTHRVFRMGGDEFLMVFRDTDARQAREILNGLREAFRANGLSVALGLVVKQAPLVDTDAVIREADRRMYLDKQRSHRQRQEEG